MVLAAGIMNEVPAVMEEDADVEEVLKVCGLGLWLVSSLCAGQDGDWDNEVQVEVELDSS